MENNQATLTDLNKAALTAQQRAWRYQNNLGARERSRSVIERMQKLQANYEEQIATLVKMQKLSDAIDPKVDVSATAVGTSISGCLRDRLQMLLTAALRDQQRRLNETKDRIVTATADLAKANEALKEFGE